VCWGVKGKNILQKAFFRSFVLAKLYTKNVPLSVVFWFFVVGSDVVLERYIGILQHLTFLFYIILSIFRCLKIIY
jgi:hypothetical protein